MTNVTITNDPTFLFVQFFGYVFLVIFVVIWNE